eukprot:scaffold1575_cov352-Prasinococcus_capsulatus_cf.AAC.2
MVRAARERCEGSRGAWRRATRAPRAARAAGSSAATSWRRRCGAVRCAACRRASPPRQGNDLRPCRALLLLSVPGGAQREGRDRGPPDMLRAHRGRAAAAGGGLRARCDAGAVRGRLSLAAAIEGVTRATCRDADAGG